MRYLGDFHGAGIEVAVLCGSLIGIHASRLFWYQLSCLVYLTPQEHIQGVSDLDIISSDQHVYIVSLFATLTICEMMLA